MKIVNEKITGITHLFIGGGVSLGEGDSNLISDWSGCSGIMSRNTYRITEENFGKFYGSLPVRFTRSKDHRQIGEIDELFYEIKSKCGEYVFIARKWEEVQEILSKINIDEIDNINELDF